MLTRWRSRATPREEVIVQVETIHIQKLQVSPLGDKYVRDGYEGGEEEEDDMRRRFGL